ncbi:MAG: GPP34 family phosphoprotein [Candidatus Marinimicrobia bacterium]|nr:GPP34 family phosphoprotein [Candidatus Neomarinimicrobiota bacterium]
MDLNLYEKYVLLTINDETGTVPFGYVKTLGFAGVLLMELCNKNHIELTNAEISVTQGTSSDPILNEALRWLSGKKQPKKIQPALQLVSSKMHPQFDTVVQGLIEKGILSREEKKFLWIFKVQHFPTQNETPENLIKNMPRGIVIYGNYADDENTQLLGLIDALNLYKEIFKKDEIKKARKKTKELVQRDAFSNDIKKIIQMEITMAIAAGIAVSTVTTSSH